MRAKSLPRPAGMMPSTPPAAATAAAIRPTVPSPPTATTISPRSAASAASVAAWPRLELPSTRTVPPAADSGPSTEGMRLMPRPWQAAGFTTKQYASPVTLVPPSLARIRDHPAPQAARQQPAVSAVPGAVPP